MIMLICMIITLSACGNNTGGGAQTTDHSSNQEPSQSEDVTVDEQAQTSAPEDTGSSNVLVAYFAFSENIGDTSAMGVDAITSASLNRHTDNSEGNLQVMAQAAVEATGGDLFSIAATDIKRKTPQPPVKLKKRTIQERNRVMNTPHGMMCL